MYKYTNTSCNNLLCMNITAQDNITPLISKRIKEIRKVNNMSQDRFGKKIGISGKTVSAYETGRAMPSMKVLETITNTYGEAILYSSTLVKDDLFQKIDNIKQFVIEIENILRY